MPGSLTHRPLPGTLKAKLKGEPRVLVLRVHRPIISAVFLFVLVIAGTRALAQESASFVMDRFTVSATASRAASARWDMAITLGQEVPVGGASLCNVGFVQNLGFWSALGYSDAPILLQVDHGSGGPGEVDLQWTGSSDSFTLYRSDLPDGVVGPPNIALTTPTCFATDAPPEELDFIYYLVLPTGAP